MVKIAIAGASGNVAQELFDVLFDTHKHDIVLLSRKNNFAGRAIPRVTWVKANYSSVEQLAQALHSVHTLLCFITPQSDPDNVAQRSLIDAAVKAGVTRYAPSEWATSTFQHMPWYAGKADIREYLKEINRDKQVLEYCLFQTGMFVNYFASPYQTTRHIHLFQNQIDFKNRRAILLDGAEEALISLITVDDFCAVIARAVEYKGKWPVIGGIRGDELSVWQLITIGEKIRGPFSVEKVQSEDLEAGVVKATWLPKVDHPAIPAAQVEKLAADLVAGMLLGISAGALRVSDEWNHLLTDYKFTSCEEFLTEAWRGRP